MDAGAGRRESDAHLPVVGPAVGGISTPPEVPPRTVPPRHGAPVLRLLGLPGFGGFRAHKPLRDPAGFHVSDRSSPPAWHRGHTGLGAFPLYEGWPRSGLFRRGPSLRTYGSTPGPPSRLGHEDLQLRPERGAELSPQQRPLLVGRVPRRRSPRGRRGLHALPLLLPTGR